MSSETDELGESEDNSLVVPWSAELAKLLLETVVAETELPEFTTGAIELGPAAPVETAVLSTEFKVVDTTLELKVARLETSPGPKVLIVLEGEPGNTRVVVLWALE